MRLFCQVELAVDTGDLTERHNASAGMRMAVREVSWSVWVVEAPHLAYSSRSSRLKGDFPPECSRREEERTFAGS